MKVLSLKRWLPVLLAIGFVAYCEIDLAQAKEVRHLPKWAWALVCLNALGGLVYLLFGKVR
jgi:Phospholipase_D-nuclease N-terminal